LIVCSFFNVFLFEDVDVCLSCGSWEGRGKIRYYGFILFGCWGKISTGTLSCLLLQLQYLFIHLFTLFYFFLHLTYFIYIYFFMYILNDNMQRIQ